MTNPLKIGSVVEVRGTRVKVLVDKEMNHSSFIFQGEIINNITVNGYVIIKKGFLDLVGKIDAEYIEDLINNKFNQEQDFRFNKGTILRILEVQILGYFDGKFFKNGVKHLPMIGNLVYIPGKQEVIDIYSGIRTDTMLDNTKKTFSIGKSIYEDISVSFSINSFFSSHIGIFGNTGSGKSNTLAKLYFELFKTVGTHNIKNKSSFHLIDFNGEYAHTGVFGLDDSEIKIINFNTNEDGDKLKIPTKYFYNPEILSILFSAKEQTQKPFIKRLLKRLKYAEENGWGLQNWLPDLFAKSLIHSSRDVFEYIKEIIDYMSVNVQSEEHEEFLEKIRSIQWHTKDHYFFINNLYFNTIEDIKNTYSIETGYNYLFQWCLHIEESDIGWCDKFILNSKLQLASDMLNRYAQFEHINPLIYRIESKVRELDLILEISDSDNTESPLMTIYSFRECGTDIKKVIPLMIAKMLFDNHKSQTKQETIEKTVHLIVDEAHNILSSDSKREGTSWKNYRLDLFEEIIKEGRKFGFYLTICSQRPFDISPTIISQIHNYFIHRLVNDKDLEMIDNTIPTLDKVSKAAIPTLSSGCCIVSGTALSMPVFIQVEQIHDKTNRPSSDNVDLCKLWIE
jgi:uncharacterized protein